MEVFAVLHYSENLTCEFILLRNNASMNIFECENLLSMVHCGLTCNVVFSFPVPLFMFMSVLSLHTIVDFWQHF